MSRRLSKGAERYIDSGAVAVDLPLFNDNQDTVHRRIMLMLNMNKIVQHLWHFIRCEQTEQLMPVFDTEKRGRSTGDMMTWYTSNGIMTCPIT